MIYSGPERRQHRVLVTRNSEYHLRGPVCVAVRDATGDWKEQHVAIGCALEGGIRVKETGCYEPYFGIEPEPGLRLCFGELLTSPLVEVKRPPKEVLSRYRNRAA